MNLLDTIREEKDKKMIGKRFILNYSDIIPSYHSLAQDEVIDYTIVEYLGKGIYKDLLTKNIISDSYNYNISEKVDFQFDLFDISKYLKQISKKESESLLERITEEQKEKISIIILKARISALKNALKQLKEHDKEEKHIKAI